MEKMSYVEITGLGYKLRRDELNGFTFSCTYTDTIELIFPTGSTPGFVEIVIHNKNQTETVNMPFDTFSSFPKTKTDKVWRRTITALYVLREIIPTTLPIFSENMTPYQKRTPLQDLLSQ